jgi:hypothetical protein
MSVSGRRPAAERAWLISARTCAAGPPSVTVGVLAAGAEVAGAARRGDAGADADDDGRARGCFVRTADGDPEREAGTVAMAAWKGRPAHASTTSWGVVAAGAGKAPGAAGSQPEGVVCRAVTWAVADAGAGPRARWWER